MIKRLLFLFFDKLRLSEFIFKLSLQLYGPNHIRSVCYHGTPLEDLAKMEEHFNFYAKFYRNIDLDGLHEFCENKTKLWSKPGLMITFDDGYENNKYIIAILEKYHFTGWFCVVPKFIDCPKTQQQEYARQHGLGLQYGKYINENFSLSWSEIETIATNHEVVCHTLTHHRILGNEEEDLLETEITTAKVYLEEKLQKPIKAFSWVGGLENNYSQPAFRTIKKAGFDYCFTTNSSVFKNSSDPLFINRNCIDSSMPLKYIIYSLSGIYDLFYFMKRHRVNKRLKS